MYPAAMIAHLTHTHANKQTNTQSDTGSQSLLCAAEHNSPARLQDQYVLCRQMERNHKRQKTTTKTHTEDVVWAETPLIKYLQRLLKGQGIKNMNLQCHSVIVCFQSVHVQPER